MKIKIIHTVTSSLYRSGTAAYWCYLFTNTHTQTITINICPLCCAPQLGSNEADCAVVRWMGIYVLM